MLAYLTISTLTDEGRKTIKKHPDRIEEVNREIENMGPKILAQYTLFEEYYLMNILDAPDNETVSKISIAFSSQGNCTDKRTAYIAY